MSEQKAANTTAVARQAADAVHDYVAPFFVTVKVAPTETMLLRGALFQIQSVQTQPVNNRLSKRAQFLTLVSIVLLATLVTVFLRWGDVRTRRRNDVTRFVEFVNAGRYTEAFSLTDESCPEGMLRLSRQSATRIFESYVRSAKQPPQLRVVSILEGEGNSSDRFTVSDPHKPTSMELYIRRDASGNWNFSSTETMFLLVFYCGEDRIDRFTRLLAALEQNQEGCFPMVQGRVTTPDRIRRFLSGELPSNQVFTYDSCP